MENKKHIRLFDAHCDTASRIYYGNSGLYRSSGHTDLSRGGAFGGYVQMYAVFTTAEDRYGEYRRILQYLRAELAKNEAYASFCTCRAEAEQAIG